MTALLRQQWARRVAASYRPLPRQGMFSRGKPTLDPRVFTADSHVIPEVRHGILSLLDGYWGPLYGDWQTWSKVYYAGSGASYWWDSDTDLDVLIGINKTILDRWRPQNVGVSEEDVCAHLDAGLKADLDPTTTSYMGFTTTFFVNPGSYYIQDIKPYAAYDLTDDRWAVAPFQPPANWGPESFPDDWWGHANAIADEVESILERPEPERSERGVAYFDVLHSERQRAYSPWGDGFMDWGNFIWQVLSSWHLLQKLYRLKHPELAIVGAKQKDETADKVIGALTDDLRKPHYRGNPNALAGHCYVASEAYYHLKGGKDSGLTPMFVHHEHEPHWFLKNKKSGEITDLTAGQFRTPVPYDQAKGKGFLTKQPSRRAQQVIDSVNGIAKAAGAALPVVENWDLQSLMDAYSPEYDSPVGGVEADLRRTDDQHGTPRFIDELAAKYRRGDRIEPVDVLSPAPGEEDEQPMLMDGHHRVFAAKIAGKAEVPVRYHFAVMVGGVPEWPTYHHIVRPMR